MLIKAQYRSFALCPMSRNKHVAQTYLLGKYSFLSEDFAVFALFIEVSPWTPASVTLQIKSKMSIHQLRTTGLELESLLLYRVIHIRYQGVMAVEKEIKL